MIELPPPQPPGHRLRLSHFPVARPRFRLRLQHWSWLYTFGTLGLLTLLAVIHLVRLIVPLLANGGQS